MRAPWWILPLLLVAACARPDPKFIDTSGAGAAKPAEGVPLGNNTVGESCTQQARDSGAEVYCGTWEQPSARVRRAAAGEAGSLTQLATTSAWRGEIDQRFACNDPQPTTILGSEPAVLLQCTRRNGGWPQIALVSQVNGSVWFADGVLPALPPLQRSIGILSGKLRADTAPAAASGADALLASRLAARAFSSGDIGQYQTLVRIGTRSNRGEDPIAAEKAFRAALALQEKALGANNPGTVLALTSVALQISDQGRFAEADTYFDRAAKLVNQSDDRTAAARLLHYRALHLANQDRLKEALAMLETAEARYTVLVPKEVLDARPRPTVRNVAFGVRTAASTDSLGRQFGRTPDEENAMLGIIETRRNRSVVYRLLGELAESDRAAQSADIFARANALDQPGITANVFRTAGLAAAASGRLTEAESRLDESAREFARALPGAKPIAVTRLRRAGLLIQSGGMQEAFVQCRSAVTLLRELGEGVPGELMAPCLAAYAGEANANRATEQQTLTEMFLAAQLTQGSVTSRQIEQAAARLSETARDPKVGAAIRQKEDIKNKLADLQPRRDALGPVPQDPASQARAAELDKQIADTRAALEEADAALQAASPNYGQLVQQVVPAADVFAALRPNEAFAMMSLSDTEGWTFLLRDKKIAVARIPGGTPRMAALVKRLRTGIERETEALPVFDPAAAQELYTATLEGVAPAMEGATALTIAPAGPLLALPFEVLLTGPGEATKLAEAPFLIRKYTIVHVPAPANFVGLRKIAGGSRAQRGWFGFGDFHPVTQAQALTTFPARSCADSAQLFAGLPPLPNARTELDVARQLLGAAPTDELLGPAFTAPAVEKLDLKDYRILHFATHALLPTDLACQTEPAIVTSAPAGAPDAAGALLTSSAVFGMKLDADAVILSACNTGGGNGGAAGESLSGLARSFFYAGARALLVTHWSVDDRTAAFLVGTTLANIQKAPGEGLAVALRDAQLALLNDAGKGVPVEIAHPFFWAPFALIGEGGGKKLTADVRVPSATLAGL